jgi:hypothetical protein
VTVEQVEWAAKIIRGQMRSQCETWRRVLDLDAYEELVSAGLERKDKAQTMQGLVLMMRRALFDIVSHKSVDLKHRQSLERQAQLLLEMCPVTAKRAIEDTIIDAVVLDEAMQPLHGDWRRLLVDAHDGPLSGTDRNERSRLRRYLERFTEGHGCSPRPITQRALNSNVEQMHSSNMQTLWPV